jgi:molybdopterin-guanine dinucleotide biosynthesis protein A
VYGVLYRCTAVRPKPKAAACGEKSRGIRMTIRVYHGPVTDLTAFVLAGGKSTRMGEDKAFLVLEGRSLLARALDLAGTVTRDVRVAGEAAKFAAFGPVVEDVYPHRGPLGGIHAALRNSGSELNLMLAVDLPFVEPRFLEYLVEQARASSSMVAVPRAAGGWQPLCAMYRLEFAAVAEKSLRAGRNKIDALFSEVETREITEEELLRENFSPDMFRNLNTREEFERAKG